MNCRTSSKFNSHNFTPLKLCILKSLQLNPIALSFSHWYHYSYKSISVHKHLHKTLSDMEGKLYIDQETKSTLWLEEKDWCYSCQDWLILFLSMAVLACAYIVLLPQM